MRGFKDSGTTSCVLDTVSLLRIPSLSIFRRCHSLMSCLTASFSASLCLCFRYACVFFRARILLLAGSAFWAALKLFHCKRLN